MFFWCDSTLYNRVKALILFFKLCVKRLRDWFSYHPSLSKEAFSKHLQLWHSILPEGNLLPMSYQEAYKIIRPYLNPEVIFDVCPNDCILFRGEYKDNVTCPKCKDSKQVTFQKEPSITCLWVQGLSGIMEQRTFLAFSSVTEVKIVHWEIEAQTVWATYTMPQNGKRHSVLMALLKVIHVASGFHCAWMGWTLGARIWPTIHVAHCFGTIEPSKENKIQLC